MKKVHWDPNPVTVNQSSKITDGSVPSIRIAKGKTHESYIIKLETPAIDSEGKENTPSKNWSARKCWQPTHDPNNYYCSTDNTSEGSSAKCDASESTPIVSSDDNSKQTGHQFKTSSESEPEGDINHRGRKSKTKSKMRGFRFTKRDLQL